MRLVDAIQTFRRTPIPSAGVPINMVGWEEGDGCSICAVYTPFRDSGYGDGDIHGNARGDGASTRFSLIQLGASYSALLLLEWFKEEG